MSVRVGHPGNERPLLAIGDDWLVIDGLWDRPQRIADEPPQKRKQR